MTPSAGPPEPSPRELAELRDRDAIQELVARYADVVTRRAFDELDQIFAPGTALHLDLVTSPPRDLDGPAEIGRFILGAIERFSFFELVPLNLVVDLYPGGDPDGATARLWMCEERCGADGHDAASEWTTAYGLYRDTFRRIDGRWWFTDRSYRSLARTGEAGVVLPFPDI